MAAALAAAGTLVSAQQTAQQPRPTFRAGVDLVQVDVVVVDADGNPVHGLTKDDFILLDKLAPQSIETFSEIIHDRPPAKLFPPGLPLDVASNQTAISDRLVMLVLDDLHFRNRTEEAKSLVRQVVNGLEGGASLGLVTTSGTFGVEITEDRERLLLELNNFLDHFDPHVGETPNTPVINARGDLMRDPGPVDPSSFFSEFHAYKTVEDVARMMGANDGRRKAMILISAGIENASKTNAAMHPPKNGLDPCFGGSQAAQIIPQGVAVPSGPAIQAMHCGGLNGMYDGLHRSSVAVYPVDPGGPKDRGDSLDPVARETGGFAVHSNDLERGMARLLDDLDNYYLLGFYPADPKDKSYHPLDVRVKRPGLTVRHRHGYQPGGPPPPPKNDKPLEQAAAPIVPKTDLPLRLGAVPLFGTGGKMQVLTTLEVGVEAPAGAASPIVNDSIEFAVYAADLKKKKVTVSDARRLDVQWTVETEKSTGTFRVQSVLLLPPGPYQLRASAISKVLDKTGSVYLQIDVPDLGDAPLALGGIALTTATAGQALPGVLHTAALQGVSLPFAPGLARAFTEADDVRVFFQVKRATAATAVTGTAAIVGTDGTERASVPWTVTPSGSSNVDLTLPLAGIAPGPYRLVVKASDGPHQATREVAIRVE
ncbi:MAG TPA: VWA domain-containing protein [Vicinamibacterales bacterium]|nr:VWA domain-containing protein [Vicinamibacterales bacterium]